MKQASLLFTATLRQFLSGTSNKSWCSKNTRLMLKHCCFYKCCPQHTFTKRKDPTPSWIKRRDFLKTSQYVDFLLDCDLFHLQTILCFEDKSAVDVTKNWSSHLLESLHPWPLKHLLESLHPWPLNIGLKLFLRDHKNICLNPFIHDHKNIYLNSFIRDH